VIDAFPVFFTKVLFQDLPGSAFGQGIHEDDCFGHLVAGNALLAKVAKLLGP
jgi:hypothetical protein